MAPIHVREIERYLPHRPPMVWIDEVLTFAEKAGECQVKLQPDGLYFDGEGRLRPTSCVEFIAQAYGFISVCHHIWILNVKKPLTKAFLASLNDTRLPEPEVLNQIKAGDTLRVLIDSVRQVGSIVIIRGRLMRGDLLIAEARMKIFKEYEV